MLSYPIDVTPAAGGAAFLGVRSPWAGPSVAGVNHALALNLVPGAGTPAAPLAAFRQIPATTPTMTTMQLAAVAATKLPTSIDNRKQYVHKTRVNVGGDGASGPHPEREPEPA